MNCGRKATREENSIIKDKTTRGKRVLIVTGGRVDRDFLKKNMDDEAYDFVLGVDRGLNTLNDMNIIPYKAIGDFDSADEGIRAMYKDSPDAIVLNPEKDYTDTHVALEYAIENGAESITIVGGTGTRIDHVLGNLALLKLSLLKGVECVLLDENNRIRMTDGRLVLRRSRQHGRYVSLIPYSDYVRGITLVGFKYGLQDAELVKEETLGISNEIVAEEALITLKEGQLLVIESRD